MRRHSTVLESIEADRSPCTGDEAWKVICGFRLSMLRLQNSKIHKRQGTALRVGAVWATIPAASREQVLLRGTNTLHRTLKTKAPLGQWTAPSHHKPFILIFNFVHVEFKGDKKNEIPPSHIHLTAADQHSKQVKFTLGMSQVPVFGTPVSQTTVTQTLTVSATITDASLCSQTHCLAGQTSEDKRNN